MSDDEKPSGDTAAITKNANSPKAASDKEDDDDESGDESDEPDAYEVERIVGQRSRLGRIEYLVQWVGYEGQDTWEPEDNLDCQQKLEEFVKSKSKKQHTGRSGANKASSQPSKADTTSKAPTKRRARISSDHDSSSSDSSDSESTRRRRKAAKPTPALPSKKAPKKEVKKEVTKEEPIESSSELSDDGIPTVSPLRTIDQRTQRSAYDAPKYDLADSFGIQRGHRLRNIISGFAHNGMLFYLVIWKESRDLDVVSADFLQRYYSGMLLSYITRFGLLPDAVFSDGQAAAVAAADDDQLLQQQEPDPVSMATTGEPSIQVLN